VSAAVLVVYDGSPDDPERFLRYYVDHHVPIVWTFPGIRGVQVDRTVEGDIFMVARFMFDSVAEARAALDSPERARARADRDNFPRFQGTVRHQIVEVLDVPRGSST
jgi:uncharacterized protein (TIGR02118 family)